ncbi:MAG: energy transducer TonB [Gemmatimonadota bacterium]|nr:energy transducer TonB [Gemmatimonadota bacterium]
MSRSLLASAAFHAVVAALVWWLGGAAADSRPMPPVYQVDLVSAPEAAVRRTPAEPDVREEEEEPDPEEPEETIPDPEEEPEPEEAEPEPDEEPPAEAAAERETEREADLPVTLEGEPFPFPWYLEQLVRKIERNWRPSSRSLSATVHFRIDASGNIREVEIEEASGNFLFDQAARRAVEAADPVPPLPEEYDGDWLGVHFVFDTGVERQ